MIKFLAHTPNGPLYGFGLSGSNIARLVSGEPIHFNLTDMGGPDMNVLIIFGETEESLFKELQATGLIPPEAVFLSVKSGEAAIQRFKTE